ncbi:MAG: FxLYD domain-containing protein [Kiloniellales bacterium]
MITTRIASTTASVALAAALSACGAGYEDTLYPLPDEPGFYALGPDSELQRLDGDRDWEVESWPQRSELSPYAEFVLYDPILSRDTRPRTELIQLWRVAWVRSDIDSRGLAMPAQGSEWAVAQMEPFHIPVAFDHPQGKPEFVHIVPRQPLEPGIYSLRLNKVGTKRIARVGVQWSSVDKRRYSAANCVDRYLAKGGAYRVCSGGSDPLEATASNDLEITLVDPLKRDDILIVQGVVTNTGPSTRQVPPMQAVLLDSQGRRLTHATIEPHLGELGPGERMNFKSEIAAVPQSTARVNVSFLPATNADGQ